MSLKSFIHSRLHTYSQSISNFNPKTVKIGNKTWMAENLSIDDGKGGIYYNKDNNEYYYTWNAAMRIAESIKGWSLPSSIYLESVIDNHRDEFDIRYCGQYMSNDDPYEPSKHQDLVIESDNIAIFWSSTDKSNELYYVHGPDRVEIFKYGKYAHIMYSPKCEKFSVRLIKD